MHPDLERLIRLQDLDNAVEHARRQIAEIPGRIDALDTRLADRDRAVAEARAALEANRAVRRGLDRDLAAVQSRLTRFKDQLMQVKTNREYQAMQTEIVTAEREAQALEDRMLERMLEADELTATVRSAEADLAAEQKAVAEERVALDEERAGLTRELERAAARRVELTREIPAHLLELFDFVARGRKGVAVTEARAGHCGVCNVRLRPQVFNEVRTNESIIQCESCQRILYFVPAGVA
jgi:predicted  nucleic acid-binding Zn-ribbon protein